MTRIHLSETLQATTFTVSAQLNYLPYQFSLGIVPILFLWSALFRSYAPFNLCQKSLSGRDTSSIFHFIFEWLWAIHILCIYFRSKCFNWVDFAVMREIVWQCPESNFHTCNSILKCHFLKWDHKFINMGCFFIMYNSMHWTFYQFCSLKKKYTGPSCLQSFIFIWEQSLVIFPHFKHILIISKWALLYILLLLLFQFI